MTEAQEILQTLREGEPVEMGSLPCPSGRIVVCDPFFCASGAPLAERVSPGEYPVVLYRIQVPGWGWRIGAARLMLHHDAEIVDVRPAAFTDSARATYFVDSGLSSFMDDAVRPHFAEVLAAFARRSVGGNYYSDVLEQEFRAHAMQPANPFDAGDYCMHAFAASPHARVAMFSSGLGDGTYTSCWGLDRAGKRAALFTSFAVLARAGTQHR
jgi:hypothetical protein